MSVGLRHIAPAALAAGAFLCAAGAAAQDITLSIPLDCDFADTCYVQQLVDRDPGPGVRDALCGDLANDGHRGTDFALPSLAMMEAGVTVRAAAPGTVRAVRDGMADIAANAPDAPGYDNRDCGNGLVIDHGDGWETQYCHMKSGSLAVRGGETVARGAPLGEVGLSGATTYPHLHLSLRRDGEVVDPLAPAAEGCGDLSGSLLPADLPVAPGGLIATGFSGGVPAFDAVEAGTAGTDVLPPDAALVLWGYVFAGRAGDVLRLAFDGPGGEPFETEVTLDADQPQLFRAAGRRAPPGGWPAGRYAGTVEMLRDGVPLDSATATVEID